MADDTETVNQTIAFLRMAAAQLRRLADSDPTLAADLRHVANQCMREADDLAKHFGI